MRERDSKVCGQQMTDNSGAGVISSDQVAANQPLETLANKRQNIEKL